MGPKDCPVGSDPVIPGPAFGETGLPPLPEHPIATTIVSKIVALVNKYVIVTLTNPRLKVELDHWIELNTIVCHLTSSESESREELLDNFLEVLKMESGKKPVPLPIFEKVLKE